LKEQESTGVGSIHSFLCVLQFWMLVVCCYRMCEFFFAVFLDFRLLSRLTADVPSCSPSVPHLTAVASSRSAALLFSRSI